MNLFNDTDLILTTDGGKVQSAGFTIFNRFLSNKVQPMYTINDKEINLDDQTKVSSIFKGVVVPIGLHQVQSERSDNSYEITEDDVEENDLYNSLLVLYQTQFVEKTSEPNSTTSKRQSTKKKCQSIHPFKTKQTKKNNLLFK